MPAVTPRETRRWAVRCLYVTAPLTVVCLVSWLAGWPEPGDHRPAIMFVAYQLMAMATLAAAMVATVAAGQLAIAKAFAVGYMAGVQATLPTDGDGDGADPKHRGRPPHLRAVDQ